MAILGSVETPLLKNFDRQLKDRPRRSAMGKNKRAPYVLPLSIPTELVDSVLREIDYDDLIGRVEIARRDGMASTTLPWSTACMEVVDHFETVSRPICFLDAL